MDLGEVSLVDRLQGLGLVGAGHQEEVAVDGRLRTLEEELDSNIQFVKLTFCLIYSCSDL